MLVDRKPRTSDCLYAALSDTLISSLRLDIHSCTLQANEHACLYTVVHMYTLQSNLVTETTQNKEVVYVDIKKFIQPTINHFAKISYIFRHIYFMLSLIY